MKLEVGQAPGNSPLRHFTVESHPPRRVEVFAKANVDVHDSLHSCRIGGRVMWNGVNEVLRGNHPNLTVRLRHETLTRFDALAVASGTVPHVFAEFDEPLGSYPLSSQFSDKIFTQPSSAVILSILPDVAATLVRHREHGFLFYPAEAGRWSEAGRAWLKANFDAVGFITVEQSMAALAGVIQRLHKARDVPVLVYNMSAYVPGDTTHCYLGLDETYATRIRRFNLALLDLSKEIGISVVDIDALFARHGADKLKIDVMHFTPEGYRLAAAETVRILADLGVLEK